MNEAMTRELLQVTSAIHDLLGELQHCAARLVSLAGGSLSTPGRRIAMPPSAGTQVERVTAYFKQCPDQTATRAELKQAFPDMNDNAISGVVTRMKHLGQLETVGRGRYRLLGRFSLRRL